MIDEMVVRATINKLRMEIINEEMSSAQRIKLAVLDELQNRFDRIEFLEAAADEVPKVESFEDQLARDKQNYDDYGDIGRVISSCDDDFDY